MAEVRPRPPREPGSKAWGHVASLIGAHANVRHAVTHAGVMP